jgi:hypothetical protein
MNRSALAPAVASLLCALISWPSAAQVKPAAPTTAAPPPAAPAKWVAPVKGIATIEVMRGTSKRVGKELVTSLKIKNTSSGSINLLRIDELWYDQKREMVTTGTERYKKPFLPGEIIDISVKSPIIGQPQLSQFTFSHANGKIEAKTVKKFE